MVSRVGVFIVIEGIDGAGKTLHSRGLCIQLHKRGFDVRYTAEPSNSFIGQLLREEFLYRRKAPPEVEALLFAADRFQHVKNEILPMLQQNGIIVSDRYYYASIAYQSAQGVDAEWIRCINSFAPKPDLAIYLDVPAEVAMSRIHRNKSVMEKIEFERRVREIYLDLVKQNELVHVDGNKPVESVSREIFNLALEIISKARSDSQE